jgi:hypothetical protein
MGKEMNSFRVWTRWALVVGCAAASGAALAQNDRWQDTPTGWSYLYGATSAQVNALSADNQRVFNIERIGANSYDAVAVTNSGDYSVAGSQISYGLTAAGLSNFLSNNNRRILDLEAYDNAGVENFVAVTVPNSGATAAGWGWLFRASQADINSWIANASPSLRLIDIDTYTLGGTKYYTAVAVNNTGSNQLGWWYYWGRTGTQVTDLLTTNGARLVDISVDREPTVGNPTTLYNVVMVANNPGAGWWYSSLSSSQVDSLLAQNGARLTALTRYSNQLGQTRFAVAMVDNANAETRRIRNAIRAEIPTGDFGFRSKEVGGPVIASLNENFQFEPASMIKILHSARAMREVQTTATTLNSPVTLNTDTSPGASCPVPATTTTPSMRTTIEQVMWNSSNEHTEALRQRYGTAGLNIFADAWNLDSTSLNHTIGCICSQWPNFNTFTARDAVSLYEQIADGSILNEDNKEELYNSLMLNYDNFTNSWLTSVINDEAADTDLTSAEISAFRIAFDAAWKGGSYTCTFSGEPTRRWRTEGAWARVPFKGVAPFFLPFDREYAITVFLNESNDIANVTDQIYDSTWETIRVPIRQALQSWDAACNTDAILFQPQNETVVVGNDTEFSVSIITRPGSRDYRWQKLINGTWTSLFNGAAYAGTDTADLTVLDAQPNDAGQFRVRITKECGETLSQPATLTVTEACDADFDGNGLVNFFDFSAFITAFNSQSSQADLAAPFGVWNFFDVNAFINAYNAGCP